MRLAMFCGSKPGNQPNFSEGVAQLGQVLGQRGVHVVYGGGKVGLMGVIAYAALAAGSEVHGVITENLLHKEIGHPGLTHLEVVASMHDRKARMADLADGFVALPGGAGTLDEIFEAWTWAQLGYHNKPVCFYNIDGFFAPLFDMIDAMVSNGFLREDFQQQLIITDDPDDLINCVEEYQPPKQKWS